jgi:hypothetical protein
MKDWNAADGGAERDRTADLVIANDALSQLSYSPASVKKPITPAAVVRQSSRIWLVNLVSGKRT